MHQLTYELKQLADTYREGSYATQHNRRHMLMQIGEQLVAAGYKKMHAGDLKGRHVTALLAQWTAQALIPRYDPQPPRRGALVGGEGRRRSPFCPRTTRRMGSPGGRPWRGRRRHANCRRTR